MAKSTAQTLLEGKMLAPANRLSMVLCGTESHDGAQLKENPEILQPYFLILPQFYHAKARGGRGEGGAGSRARQRQHIEETSLVVWSFYTLLPCRELCSRQQSP